ncbi:MAG: magnesium chelatase subunit H [Brevundimonas sp.]|uniref:magnesium chelatase subunit H n=1 Tax=Brevundimonas sp. TaxID=1871086 RepID=UPI002734215C|nr:magnesium chelatase subunit H [Brevundimonas sp.]MDP3406467.1 magnesium chelatase subunit H [Brevundimonas sp.]
MPSRTTVADPTVPAGLTPRVRVVIVTLDNHLAGAVAQAETELRRSVPGLTVALHAASEWGSDPVALNACLADIAQGDLVIASMLFVDDHIQMVLPALRARNEACDAMVCMMSAAEVVKLTRMGAYRMDGSQKGPLAMLKKLRGNTKATGGVPGEKQMAMLRRLPKILAFIPGTAQDVRAYFLTLQYWFAGSTGNMVSMVRYLLDRYADGERRSLRGALKAAAPIEYPDVGVYHPRMGSESAGRMAESVEALPPHHGRNGTVGLVILRSYVLANDAAHYDGVIAAFEARGVRVVPAFANGLDARPAMDKLFMKDGRPTVDALINLTGFSLVGGPAYNNSEAAAVALGKFNVPYISAHPLEFQSFQQWSAGHQGLLPLEATMMVSIPELDGGIAPMMFGGRTDGSDAPCTGCVRRCTFPADSARAMLACPERAETLAARVEKMIALRRSDRAERRIAAVLFNFPPNAGAAGTAAQMSVWASLHKTLIRLAAEGYTVEVPESVDALREAMLDGNAARYGTDGNVHVRIPADEHVRRERWLSDIEAVWGPAPGKSLASGSSIFVLGARFGNVFVGLQPPFGIEGDPMRLMFEGGFAPTHAFSAFYRWIREDFGAHAVLHFGTHGALEFMPGKQTGLSEACWPDRLIGDLPNLYLYAANNPSEGMIAKRRSNATLISYITPPINDAGLYKGLLDLKALVDRWRGTELEASAERAQLTPMIFEAANALHIDLIEGSDDARVHALIATLQELEQTLIPNGLHVLGEPFNAEERADLLLAVAEAREGPRPGREAVQALVDGADARTALGISGLASDTAGIELFRHLHATNVSLSTNPELEALIAALDGGYVMPSPGGDLLRTPEMLPTGRNIHGFDPFRIPSAYAVADGMRQADRLLAKHRAETGAFPESMAIVLWGTDNLKSEGGPIAQAMALMGARPRFDGYGRLCGAELVSLEDLGRPRVDVIATVSGIFRDLLPLQMKMLADAAWLAATADEPIEQNFVRKRALEHQGKLGCDMETASLRVFSNAEGAYGASVNALIDSGAWTEEGELADAFESRKGFAYGRNGKPMKQPALLTSALAGIDLAYQNLDSVDLGVTTIDHYVDTLGGVAKSAERARGKASPVYIGDQTQGEGKVRTLAEQVTLESRTRVLNPRWFEGQLKHGSEGVRAIEAQVTNTLGWSATTGDVQPWVYQEISETFVLDATMRDRLATLNPKASARMANRLLEASDRAYWAPDAATLQALRDAADELEDRLEGLSPAAAA